MAQRTKVVIATIPVVGYHHWDGAPSTHDHLRVPHRHLFTFKVEVLVDHSDRAVEFHTLQERARSLLYGGWPHHGKLEGLIFGGHSCEHLAEWLMGKLHQEAVAVRAVEVWEDMENGSRVEAQD